MKKKSLSIVDIAKQLNISQTTVSFILNGKSKDKRISDEMTDKVLRFVEKVGYKPNLLARSFRTGKTNIIGLMVEDISNPFFANVARLIEEKAYTNGYKILYCSTENDARKAQELLLMFKDRCVDGYIITPTESLSKDVEGLVSSGAPVILFDRRFEDDRFDYVLLDNQGSAYNAAKHLIDQGFREIGFITINSLQTQMKDRMTGYEKAMEEHGLNQYIKEVSFSLNTDQSVEHIEDFLRRKKKMEAVIFSTNYLGISGLRAIKNLGLSIPNDLAVISFDDHILFDLYSPTITSIAQPIEEMSAQLINILLQKLSGGQDQKNAEKQQIILPGQMILRQSSVRP
ncbi:MAG: LacI family transcriptional regulator [Citrobacter freundii]|nr:MAG: LacI family transcriptional regulator [Citrobacter freundii]